MPPERSGWSAADVLLLVALVAIITAAIVGACSGQGMSEGEALDLVPALSQ
jgi:hypothetical protein